MYCLTALIVPHDGVADRVESALREIALHAAQNEPGTLGYHVVRSAQGSFVTYERYADEAAMQTHNDSPACAAFFARVEGLLARVEVVTGHEIFAG